MPWLAAVLLALTMTAAATEPANRLKDHPSPYLALHGADPVHWQDWGPEALERARRENKPLFVSSGYFACHWCHVMQQESYRDAGIAALLNEHFIPVKVDRELHPALDAYLIDFVERTRGQAGWPLNVFLTPEGQPLIGLTYAPPETFRRLLVRLAGAWEGQAEQLKGMARSASEELHRLRRVETRDPPADPAPLLEAIEGQSLALADELQGGFGHQSRFPMAPQLTVLLEVQARQPDDRLKAFLGLTLGQMGGQGMRDILGGGFFRYTVDPDWQIPHFEKMLYDQALLIPLYLRAAEVLDRPVYRALARDTLDFVLVHMAAPGGGYIASLSALDDKGVEGGAYLWKPEELDRLLEDSERELAALVWRMRGPANNEGGYLPVQAMDPVEAGAQLGLGPEETLGLLGKMRSKLLLARAARGLPRDGKPVAAWNGLMLSALVAADRAFDGAYRTQAVGLRDFIVGRLWDGSALHRSLAGGIPLGEAALEDYALVARGLWDWAGLSGREDDRALAARLVRQAWERFFDDQGWRQAERPLIPGIPPEPALPDSPLPSPAAALLALTPAVLGSSQDDPLKGRLARARVLAYPVASESAFTYAGTAWALARGSAPGDSAPGNSTVAQPGAVQQ